MGRRRGRRKGAWANLDRKAVLVLALVGIVAFALSQVSNFYYVWLWGPNTGHRAALLQSGHYERSFPAISHSLRYIGRVVTGGGRTLTLDYDAEVTAGQIQFTVWRVPISFTSPVRFNRDFIDADRNGRLQMDLPSAGIYRIYMHTQRFQGGVSVDWTLGDTRPALADGTR